MRLGNTTRAPSSRLSREATWLEARSPAMASCFSSGLQRTSTSMMRKLASVKVRSTWTKPLTSPFMMPKRTGTTSWMLEGPVGSSDAEYLASSPCYTVMRPKIFLTCLLYLIRTRVRYWRRLSWKSRMVSLRAKKKKRIRS